MVEIIYTYSKYLLILGALMACNILLGVANSIAIRKYKFDSSKFISGVVKALVSGVGIITLAIAFNTMDLSSLGITPMTIVSTGIITYAGKCTKNIMMCMGIGNMDEIITKAAFQDHTENREDVHIQSNTEKKDKVEQLLDRTEAPVVNVSNNRQKLLLNTKLAPDFRTPDDNVRNQDVLTD